MSRMRTLWKTKRWLVIAVMALTLLVGVTGSILLALAADVQSGGEFFAWVAIGTPLIGGVAVTVVAAFAGPILRQRFATPASDDDGDDEMVFSSSEINPNTGLRMHVGVDEAGYAMGTGPDDISNRFDDSRHD